MSCFPLLFNMFKEVYIEKHVNRFIDLKDRGQLLSETQLLAILGTHAHVVFQIMICCNLPWDSTREDRRAK